jgi:hypothetical protein
MARPLKFAAMLAPAALCLFEFMLRYYSKSFSNYEQDFLSLPYLSSVSLLIWCGVFTVLTCEKRDVLVIVFLTIAAIFFFLNINHPSTEAFTLFFSLAVGKGIRFFSKQMFAIKNSKIRLAEANIVLHDNLGNFLIGLVFFLTLSSWWHLDFTKTFYHGPRWMGLWDNPNIYGMLMGAGLTLAIGLLAGMKKEELRMKKLLLVFLLISAGMMGIGLLFSYSRGTWVGTAVGLLYLAKAHGKLKWRLVLPGILVVVAVVFFFWHSTADTDQWYLKRLDLSRPSAQHRVSAWRGALQMMRDHPLGVGWNQAVETYDKNYSPPENGAAALTMNSYLMLGTELGLPGLICFISYVALCLRSPKPKVQSPKSVAEAEEPARGDTRPTTLDIGKGILDSSKTTYRAGSVVLLVAFWFDGGLFTLATSSVFWVLLELGAVGKASPALNN